MKDWAIHKLICSSMATLDKLSLPDKNAKLGFYFPESGKKAELIWVLISETGEPVFDEHLNMREAQKFACGVATIVLRKDFRSDQSKVNKCIQRALKSNASEEKETPNEVWRGPVVMFKLAKSRNNKMIYVNVLPLDFNMFISQVLEAGPPKNEDEC